MCEFDKVFIIWIGGCKLAFAFKLVVRCGVIGFLEKISRVHFVSVMQKGIINGVVVSGFKCGDVFKSFG